LSLARGLAETGECPNSVKVLGALNPAAPTAAMMQSCMMKVWMLDEDERPPMHGEP
jgi:hypothetical protein